MPTLRASTPQNPHLARILDAARADFLAHGFEGASLNRIIQTSGTSKGTLYYHFADKADLFVTILKGLQDEVLDDATPGAIHSADEFWAYVERVMRSKLAMAVREPGWTRVVAEVMHLATRTGAPEGLRAFRAYYLALAEPLFELGQRVGAIRTDLPLRLIAELHLQLGDVLLQDHLAGPKPDDPAALEAHSRRVLDLVKRLVRPEPSTGRPRAVPSASRRMRPKGA